MLGGLRPAKVPKVQRCNHTGKPEGHAIDSETPIPIVHIPAKGHSNHVHALHWVGWGRLVGLTHTPGGVAVIEHRPGAFSVSVCEIGIGALCCLINSLIQKKL